MKKRIYLSVLVVLTAIGLWAQPQAFNYQAVVRSTSGEIIANQAVGLQINIRDVSSNGTIIYQESHLQTTNAFGLVNLKIGEGTPTIGTFSAIDWRTNAKFLEILADVAGGTNYISMGTSRLESVPYALFSQNASDSYWEKSGDDIHFNTGNVGLGINNPQSRLHAIGDIRIPKENKLIFGNDGSGDGEFIKNALWGLGFYVGWNEKLRINPDGNVGIGTASTNGKLTVLGSTAGETVLHLSQMASSNHLSIKAGIEGVNNDPFVFNTSAGDVMTIHNGNIGIGTTNPTATFEVESKDENAAVLRSNVTSTDVTGRSKLNLHFKNHGAAGIAAVKESFNTAGLALYTEYGYSTEFERMRIKSTGEVGIGTNNPIASLQVKRQASPTIAYFTTSDFNGSGGVGSALEINTGANTGNTYSEIRALSSGFNAWNNLILQSGGGNVGIGTTSPGAKLHVESPAYTVKLASGSYGVYGEHSTSGSYGWLGASNEGGYGYSPSGYGLRGQTTNGFGIHGTATGTGFAGYFDGKAYFSGNVGIGTTSSSAKLTVAANAGPNIVIHDANASNDRPGIQFTNNYIHYIGGDDGSDEYFGFYSAYGNNRTYDAVLNIHGKATNDWGKSLSLTHNGTHGRIYTDAGDLLLQPAGGVAINTSSAGAYKLNVNGDAYVSGTIKTATKTGSIIIPPAAFEAQGNDGYYFQNYGSSIVPLENYLYFNAPLYLPHGVTITSMTSYWQDNSTSNGQIEIARIELSSGAWGIMANNTTNWQNTIRTGISTNAINYPQIDNQNYFYYIWIALHTNIYFYGVKIEYTYDEIK